MKNFSSAAVAGSNKTVLVTGAAGFIGRHLCVHLASKGFRVRAAVRQLPAAAVAGASETVVTGEINADTVWAAALGGVDCVVHLAGRAHVMHERAAAPLTLYRQVNALGTRCLAQAAAKQGVKRFVFISSIKVNGETSGTPEGTRYFSEELPVAPQDPYAVSKWEGEQALLQVCHDCRMEPVVLRLPLVYGKGVRANFAQLVKLVKSGIPLPLAAVKNRRSMLYVENLCELIFLSLVHPRAAGQLFLLSDGKDLSTPELIRLIAAGLQVKAHLFPCPVFLLNCLAAMVRKQAAVERLTGSLCVNNQKSIALLGWKPRFSLKEGIRRTVEECMR
ncbi:MAG TPA: SDR family oxidoreductase [Candidatus Omnitrophota bacterium]|nr:SDR family oxidoreductase [Candidatus Omnitrophota bacterium]HRZ15165.1 SDR family oxidoreductase [Candidatus Omnitrophota bacterium]